MVCAKVVAGTLGTPKAVYVCHLPSRYWHLPPFPSTNHHSPLSVHNNRIPHLSSFHLLGVWFAAASYCIQAKTEVKARRCCCRRSLHELPARIPRHNIARRWRHGALMNWKRLVYASPALKRVRGAARARGALRMLGALWKKRQRLCYQKRRHAETHADIQARRRGSVSRRPI